MKNVALAYCIDNIHTAEEIERQLSRASYVFEHFYSKKTTEEEPLSARLRPQRRPILLIISDNFLKSAQCMSGGLKLLQERSHDTLPLVVDGYTRDEKTGQIISAPTQFDRVSDIIKYINYWQDQYLDLRKQKRQLQGAEEERFNDHLKVMRDVSGEVGEFLRTLRNLPCLTYEELSANGFERFFRFVQDDASWRLLRDLPPLAPEVRSVPTSQPVPEPEPAAPEFDLTDIPGVGLLPQTEPEEPAASLEDQPQALEALPIEAPVFAELNDDTAESHVAFQPEPVTEAHIQQWISQANNTAQNGDVAGALSLLSDLVAQQPDIVSLRYQYAILLARYGGELAESINQLEVVLDLESDHEDALFLMGQLAELREDFLLAKNSYEKLIDVNDENANAWYRLGMVIAAQFPDQIEWAAKCFKKAAKYDATNVDALYRYASLLADPIGKPHKAIKYFEKMLKIAPDHAFANYDLAVLYHQIGNRESAREYYLRAVKINPELKTPENDQAFEYKVSAAPVISADTGIAHDTIEALKQSIRQLEEMLQAQEAEAAKQASLPMPEPELLPGEGKTVLITGATSGIGRATALLLAQNGYRLILTGRRRERLEELQESIENEHDISIKTLHFDVRDPKAAEKAINNLSEDWQQIDILINNAGKAKGFHPIYEGLLEHWEEMIDTNLKGLLYVTRLVAPLMVRRRQGHILNISSIAGKEVYPNGNVYCATKFAVEALTKAMRLDLHMHNIRVSQVAPGHVEETEFALVRFDGDAERAKIYEDFQPLTAQDVAETILWAITRPPHVNVEDILLMSTQQASASVVNRSGR
ncbi:MAG TPA: SDR family NAD(P)-dependent oxidoreductase [Saprospiraceae bacterium]|nr:SDR family NAD(P)-dependent oxidoreductase [Saprospiraceae bacterium]